MRRRFALFLVALLGLSLAPEASGQYADSGADLAQAFDDIEHDRQEQERLQSEIEGLVAQRNAARQRLRQRVRTFYRLRRAGALPLAGGFEALLTHQARIDRLERMVRRDVRGLGELDQRVATLSEEVSATAQRLEAAERRADDARRREQAQMEQMQILSGMIEDPEAWSGPAAAGGFGIRYSDGASVGPSLASERGRLPLPVSGTVQLRDAQREGGAGLDVIAPQEARVRAVARGSVAYAAAHPGYGRLVIVSHDGDYYTVYGGLGRIAVEVGQQVDGQALLGSVGPQALFFQVRRGTRPLSARDWLGI